MRQGTFSAPVWRRWGGRLWRDPGFRGAICVSAHNHVVDGNHWHPPRQGLARPNVGRVRVPAPISALLVFTFVCRSVVGNLSRVNNKRESIRWDIAFS